MPSMALVAPIVGFPTVSHVHILPIASSVGEFSKFTGEKSAHEDQVVLVNPSDMGNAGTIMRTALGFGYKKIILIKPCIDIFNPKVVRSSMVAIFSLNIIYYDSIEGWVRTDGRSDLEVEMARAIEEFILEEKVSRV